MILSRARMAVTLIKRQRLREWTRGTVLHHCSPRRNHSILERTNSCGRCRPNSTTRCFGNPSSAAAIGSWESKLFRNENANCFASCLAFVLMTVSKETLGRWPQADEVTPRAKKFFRLVEVLRDCNDECTLEDRALEADLATAVNTALSGGSECDKYPGVGASIGSPVSLLASFVDSAADSKATEDQLHVTRGVLGVDQPWSIIDGCSVHYGQELHPPLLYQAPVCSSPHVTCLSRRGEIFSVQQALDAQDLAWRQGLYSTASRTGRCPLCDVGPPSVRCARGTGLEPPDQFFVTVARASTSDPSPSYHPTPSPCVSAYGSLYRLVAVIHSVVGAGHFIAQALYHGCWWINDDVEDINAKHAHVYSESPAVAGGAEPHLMAYVRQGEAGDDFEVIERRIARWEAYDAQPRPANPETWTEVRKRKGKLRYKLPDEVEGRLLPETLPWDENASATIKKAYLTLAWAFQNGGYACVEAESDSSEEKLLGACGRPTELSMMLATFWVEIIFFAKKYSLFVRTEDYDEMVEEATSRGFPRDLILEVLAKVPNLRWTHTAKTNWAKLLGGKEFSGVGILTLWTPVPA